MGEKPDTRRRSRATYALAALALGLVLGAPAARGSLAIALDLPALTRLSDHVVVAEVRAVQSAWNADRSTIVTNIELEVRESWKGDVTRGRPLSVRQLGGAVDDVIVRVPGQASFTLGERAVLFLRGPAQAAQVIGLGQGKRRIYFDDTHARWMVDGADRSAAVHVAPDGEMTHAASEPAQPLATLRKQVRALERPTRR